MPRSRARTADEFAKELANDPDYQARRRERAEFFAALSQLLSADEAALVGELCQAGGVAVSSVWDLVNTSAPYPELHATLVRHLDLPHHPRIREGIIRALTVKDAGPEVEAALLRHFHEETDPARRWVLANALKTAMPLKRPKQFPKSSRRMDVEPNVV